jgi:signal transduction histidine kinase
MEASPCKRVDGFSRHETADLIGAIAMQLELASPQRRVAIGDWAKPRPLQHDPVEGRMAHDLRNILNIISGNLALLSRTLGDDAIARKHIDRAMAGVDLGTRLAGSAIGRGCPTMPAVTDVMMARASIENVLREAAGPSVEVAVTMSSALPIAAVEQAALENVLINLAINARHAMNGVGLLRVTFENEDRAGRRSIAMTVADTGCGMPRHVIDRAFDPYFSTKGEGGSGLGLATVKRFVDGCGGSIDIESRVGSGTAIRIRIPASNGCN